MSKKIMVVDGSDIWLFAAKHLLGGLGFSVATYDCGLAKRISEAITVVEEENPDLILLDHLLNKNFDGLGVAEELLKRRSQIVSTGLTIARDDDLRKRYVSLNVIHFPGKTIGRIKNCILEECDC